MLLDSFYLEKVQGNDMIAKKVTMMGWQLVDVYQSAALVADSVAADGRKNGGGARDNVAADESNGGG